VRRKLDENLPERLVPILTEIGHEVDTVIREGSAAATTTTFGPKCRRRSVS
jgi:hypothetical protein